MPWYPANNPVCPVTCLRCWVGHHSPSVSSQRLVDCAQASEVTIRGLDIVFGDWVGAEHAQWACVKTPHLGTITRDCVLMVSGQSGDTANGIIVSQENLPEWWQRLCNGGVCYCNDVDGCNGSKKLSNHITMGFIYILIFPYLI